MRVKTVVQMMVLIGIAAIPAFGQTKVTPDEFVVRPGAYRYFEFTIQNVLYHVYGEFRVSGGARNDIKVYIIPREEMENFANGNRINAYYSSGSKTVDRFDVQLGDGSYYLIFDNRNSIVSAKEVATRIFIERN